MSFPEKKQGEWPTRRGTLTISSYCGSAELEPLSMKGTFVAYANYRPIISSKQGLQEAALQPESNVTVAYSPDRFIVGFAVLQFPDPSERWYRVGNRIMMEVSTIEVSRRWRFLGLSNEMLRFLVDDPVVEERILYMVGYSWTWDLVGTGLTAIQYRQMMIRLFSNQGFKSLQTNEPNIMMRPENVFMARIGAGVTDPVQRKFKLVRFNIDD